MTAAELVTFLLAGGRLVDLQERSDFATCVNTAKLVAASLLDEIGSVVPIEGRTLGDILKVDGRVLPGASPRLRLRVLSGGRS
jgi:hypothetical protein